MMIGFCSNDSIKSISIEVGKSYTDLSSRLEQSKLHFWTSIPELLKTYPPINRKYYIVSSGKSQVEQFEPTCTRFQTFELFVIEEISLNNLIQMTKFYDDLGFTNTVSYKDDDCVLNNEDFSTAIALEDFSTAINSGKESSAIVTNSHSVSIVTAPQSNAIATCDYSTAITTSNNAVAVSLGKHGKVQAGLHSHIILADWKDDSIQEVKSIWIDGKYYLPNTLYTIEEGEIIECKSSFTN